MSLGLPVAAVMVRENNQRRGEKDDDIHGVCECVGVCGSCW